MNNPAQVSDLTAMGYTVDDETVAQRWLDVAWRALRREVPTLEASITNGELDTADVIDVVCAAALRVLRNPEGYTETSGRLDDYQESWKLGDHTKDVYFTAAELRRLASLMPPTFAGSMKYL